MFDIGGEEALLLIILGLLFFGPRRLPEIGRQLGSFIAQMRHAMRDFQGTLEREVALEEVRKAAREFRQAKEEAEQAARQLSGVGAPPYADPSRQDVAGETAEPPAEPAGEPPPDPPGLAVRRVEDGGLPPIADDATPNDAVNDASPDPEKP